MSQITLGLSQILVADAAADGVMPETMTKIGKTYKDSCKLAQAASDVTEHFEEGKASPEVRLKNKKIPTLTFQIMDADVQLLADFVGGTVIPAGTSPATPAKWGFDGTEKVENKAIRVQTEQGMWLDIPNGDIEAVVNSEFSKKGIFMVDFTITPMAVTSGKAIYGYVPLD